MRLCLAADLRVAADLESLIAHLDAVAVPVLAATDADQLGVTLRPTPMLAAALAADGVARRRLRHELDARGLSVLAIDAAGRAGDAERPDWGARGRLPYTLDCATLLADLLPDDVDQGTVLTVGLGARDRWSALHTARATTALTRLTAGLRPLAHRGRPVGVALVPEPGLMLDTLDEAVIWLAGRVDSALVGLCVDPDHVTAVGSGSADASEAVERLYRSGLRVAAVIAGRTATDDVVAAVRRRPRPGPDPLLLACAATAAEGVGLTVAAPREALFGFAAPAVV